MLNVLSTCCNVLQPRIDVSLSADSTAGNSGQSEYSFPAGQIYCCDQTSKNWGRH